MSTFGAANNEFEIKRARQARLDKFACYALMGLLNSPATDDYSASIVAESAYRYAEAMLEERENHKI